MNQFMNVAVKLAEENLNTNDGGPFGACIVRDGKIIGKGANLVLKDNDPTAHAEIVAIRDACKKVGSYDLSDCEIYTTCFPCPMCLSAIIWSNIKKIHYGNTRKDAANIGFRDDIIYDYINSKSYLINTSLLSFECIDREETIKAFKEYSVKKNKKNY